jgi:hypothetical protein
VGHPFPGKLVLLALVSGFAHLARQIRVGQHLVQGRGQRIDITRGDEQSSLAQRDQKSGPFTSNELGKGTPDDFSVHPQAHFFAIFHIP